MSINIAKIRSAAIRSLAVFLDQTNPIIITLTALAICYTRSFAFVYFTSGGFACAYTVKFLKTLIRQPRPVYVSGLQVKARKSYGMPSTHSAVITYCAVYICLASAYLPIHPALPDSEWTRLLPPLIAVPWACSVVHSRIWLGHHTWPQCIAGCLCGTVFAFTCFRLWASGRLASHGQVALV